MVAAMVIARSEGERDGFVFTPISKTIIFMFKIIFRKELNMTTFTLEFSSLVPA